ncbi:hypothetical protein [Streptomyces odonnellii]|uniref:hypothetical protein n=1 Tax=Streptomyces odonnellii TaxID=1417980 RepID=UPI000A604A8A|nr:hypothetical protein [Streptomyces odonnellii]
MVTGRLRDFRMRAGPRTAGAHNGIACAGRTSRRSVVIRYYISDNVLAVTVVRAVYL